MALKTLSTFLSPLTFPHSSIFNPRIPNSYTKSTIIFCRLQQSQQTHDKTDLAEAQLPEPRFATEGTGAAAPTPGDRFLEHNRSVEAAKLIVKENKKKKKKKKEKPFKVSTTVACCYGCGAPLQTSEEDAPGYVDTETYALV